MLYFLLFFLFQRKLATYSNSVLTIETIWFVLILKSFFEYFPRNWRKVYSRKMRTVWFEFFEIILYYWILIFLEFLLQDVVFKLKNWNKPQLWMVYWFYISNRKKQFLINFDTWIVVKMLFKIAFVLFRALFSRIRMYGSTKCSP